ncbi:uncharacterized protein LOC105215693 [Zeugodacus cucurbitae]|uniref:uncharacterized protein LOC105215693 n=1 Tax=Zeugodacus cucurbitae TaxID=28588 RepID=UPI0023D8F2E8|nr:uncharacterized protein LOC105215693 [Zeugodacus cucurbitae]
MAISVKATAATTAVKKITTSKSETKVIFQQKTAAKSINTDTNMMPRIFRRLLVLFLLMHLQLSHAAPPLSPNDIDYNDSNIASGNGSPGNTLGNLFRGNNNYPMDYNMMFTHVKDFFMYLPVMMTTLRESMAGFPKFAEGIRILTSKNGRLEGADCNCEKNSNEIDSRQYG